MDANEYLAFLRTCMRQNESDRTSQRELDREFARLRAQQLDDPALAELYEQVAQEDPAEFRTRFMNEHILTPLKRNLSAEVRAKVDSVPMGVLPIRSVNACAALSPAGTPVILLDSGLVMMGHFYLETKPTAYLLNKQKGLDVATAYLESAYQFILQYYGASGGLSFPNPDVNIKLPFEYMADATMKTVTIEAFVLCHELAHVYLGHLDRSKTRTARMTDSPDEALQLYQPSWEQEYEADALGWDWYQQAWQGIPGLELLPRPVAKTAPLYLFELMALVEKNSTGYNRYTSHPPATHRFAYLVKRIHDEGDPEITGFAINLLKIAANMPVVKGA
jgi:hypothetical protein